MIDFPKILIKLSEKKSTVMGLLRKDSQLPSNRINDCAREVSINPPNTNPMIIGAGLNPKFLRKYPIIPAIIITHTSIIDC